jgi:lysozyme
MGKRCNISIVLATICFSILATCITSNPSWVRSVRPDARVVQVQPRDDAYLSLGLQELSESYNSVHSESLPKPNKTVNEIIIQLETDTMNLTKLIEYEEGFRSHPYLCSEGYVTIGYGTKLHNNKGLDPKDFPITVDRIMASLWLNQYVVSMENKLLHSSKGKIFDRLGENRRAIILSMAYQMGVFGVLKFPSMWKALDVGDWEEAGRQALDSRWAAQTPSRAKRHARVLAGETLTEVYGD